MVWLKVTSFSVVTIWWRITVKHVNAHWLIRSFSTQHSEPESSLLVPLDKHVQLFSVGGWKNKQTAKLAVRHKYCGDINNNSVSHDHNQVTNVKVELTFAVQHGFRLEVELRWVQFWGAGADGMWREGESLGRRLSRTGSFSTDGAGGNVLLLGNGNSWGELNEQMDKHYPSIHQRSSTSVNNTLKYYPKPWHF